MCVLVCGCALGYGEPTISHICKEKRLSSSVVVTANSSSDRSGCPWALFPIPHWHFYLLVFVLVLHRQTQLLLVDVCDRHIMSGRQYSTAPLLHTCWFLCFSAHFPQCPRERFFYWFWVAISTPSANFFLAKTFHENGAFFFSTLDRCTRNLNWLGNVAWRMSFIQVAADGGKYLQQYF